jgi:ParB family transcriptional regulator, chromosome partitioning protein
MKFLEHGSVVIADIEVGNRLRAVDEDVAQGLAAILKTEVLQHPIQLMQVGNRLRLGPGGHRLRAFQILGRDSIPAIVWEAETNDPEAELRMMEITENIGRRELSAIDRAAHIAELRLIFVKLRGETRGGDRKSESAKRQSFPFWSLTDEVSGKMKLSERTVRADAELYNGLSPATRKAVVGTFLADNRAQLASLAKQPHEDQKALLKILLAAEPKASTMGKALALHHNKVDLSTPDEKAFAAFVKLWGRASKQAQKQMRLYIESQTK